MNAARITRHQEQAEPAPRRDVIGSLLFWKLDYFEAHPLICFAGIILTIVVNGVLERLP